MTETDPRNPDRARLDNTLTGEQQVRIWHAKNRLPFAADSRITRLAFTHDTPFGPTYTPVTGDDIALFLKQLGLVLRDYAERHRQLEDEHAALKRDVAAVQRVFGTVEP